MTLKEVKARVEYDCKFKVLWLQKSLPAQDSLCNLLLATGVIDAGPFKHLVRINIYQAARSKDFIVDVEAILPELIPNTNVLFYKGGEDGDIKKISKKGK